MARPLNVLITRPAHQANALIAAVEQLGHNAIACPTLCIDAVDSPDLTTATPECNVAIFVSANAVAFADAVAPLSQQLGSGTAILAIGPATAQRLLSLGLSPLAFEHDSYDSEHLLSHSAITCPEGQTISLYRGCGGRDLLANTLRARGAQVVEHIVYRRRAPTDTEFERYNINFKTVDVVMSGSNETLDNLVTLVGDSLHTQLLSTALVVNSARARQHAIALGFHAEIEIAQPAGDDGQLSALQRLAQ